MGEIQKSLETENKPYNVPMVVNYLCLMYYYDLWLNPDTTKDVEKWSTLKKNHFLNSNVLELKGYNLEKILNSDTLIDPY